MGHRRDCIYTLKSSLHKLVFMHIIVPNMLTGLTFLLLLNLVASYRYPIAFKPLHKALRKAHSYEQQDAEIVDKQKIVSLSTAEESSMDMSAFKEGIKFPTNINGSDVRVGIIMARWNADIIGGLYKGINESLTSCGVKPSNVFTTYVPGSFELPVTARLLAMSKRVDVVICVGCLIKGETMHFEYISEAVSQGIMRVSLDSLIPCIFGVLTVLNKEQAIARSSGEGNEGLSWGRSAVEMGLARMSALGMDKPQSKVSESNPFVTFVNGTLPSTANNSTKSNRKFGF